MKKFISILMVLAMFGSVAVAIPIAKADAISNDVSVVFLEHYKMLSKKAKGDKRKLSALVSIRKATLKKIAKTPGWASRTHAVNGVLKMRLVVKK